MLAATDIFTNSIYIIVLIEIQSKPIIKDKNFEPPESKNNTKIYI